ncbi:ABC transporter permease [Lolliginicoccus suaedae]|uniref:ABC transporter permease n=1 Tax=Lolliginicoccus suaedae TaxID=2605429 RepID=UPI0011EE3F99|nr:ABC transporter permease [Lolliginicoccus suaedae]
MPAPLDEQAASNRLTRVNAPRPFLLGFGTSAREVWRYRELLGNLIRKQVTVKHKNSFLGFLWSLQIPLVQLAVYWLVVGQILRAGDIPYFGLFIFCGLAVWAFFADLLQSTTASIVSNSALVKKVYFPRELFPLSTTGAAVVNFSYYLAILLGGVALAGVLSGVWPDPARIALPALGLLTVIVFGLALGMFLAAVNVYLRDVQHFVTVIMMPWFWLTPIIYDISMVERALPAWLYEIYLLNPMVPVIYSFRAFFWPQGVDYGFGDGLYPRLLLALGVSLVLLWISQRIFSRLQGNFAQEL